MVPPEFPAPPGTRANRLPLTGLVARGIREEVRLVLLLSRHEAREILLDEDLQRFTPVDRLLRANRDLLRVEPPLDRRLRQGHRDSGRTELRPYGTVRHDLYPIGERGLRGEPHAVLG